MAVAEAQRAYAQIPSAASTTISASLTGITPGNLLIAVLNGNPTGAAVTGWTSVISAASTTWNDARIYTRIAVSGDNSGSSPVTFSFPVGGNWDTQLLLLEVAGSNGTVTYSAGDANWTLSSHTMPNISLAAPANSLAYVLFGLNSGTASPAVGADTLTNGWSVDSSQQGYVSSSYHSYFVTGHTAFGAAGTASTTLYAPTYANANQPNTPITFVIAPAPPPVAFTIQQKVSATSGATSVTSIAISPAATTVGNVLVAFVASNNSAAIQAVTPPSGFTLINTAVGSTLLLKAYVSPVTVSASSFTFGFSRTTLASIALIEVSGNHPTNPVAYSASNSTSSGTTITTANFQYSAGPGELVLAGFNLTTAASGSPSTGWTEQLGVYNGSMGVSVASIPLTTAAQQGLQVTETVAASTPMGAVLVVLQPHVDINIKDARVTISDSPAATRIPYQSVTRNLTPTDTSAVRSDSVVINDTVQGVTTVAGSPYTTTILADSPSVYYRLGDSGSTANDQGSLNQDGVIGAGLTMGTAGLLVNDADTAALFPGSATDSGSIDFPRVGNTLEPVSAISVELLFSVPAIPPTATYGYTLLAYGADQGQNLAPYKIDLFSNGMTCVLQAVINTTAGSYVVASAPISASIAYHVVATYDGANLTLYLNGVLTSVSVNAPFANYNVTNGLRLGCADDYTGNPYSGTLDEVAIYSGVTLTPQRVSAHYAAFIGFTAYEVQRQYSYGGAVANQTVSLLRAPTVGNTLFLVVMGYPNDTPPTGWTLLNYYDGSVNNIVVWTRVVQSGDSSAVSFVSSTDYDDGALLVEFAGAISSVAFAASDQPYSATTTSMATTAISVQQGTYVYAFFALALTAGSYTPSGSSLSNGFTFDQEYPSQTTARGSTFVFGHTISSISQQIGTTLTLPSLTITSGQQLQATLAVNTTQATIASVNVSDTRSGFSDSVAIVDNHTTDFANVSDVRTATSDAPALLLTRALVPTDTRLPFSDFGQAFDIPSGTHLIAPVDTRSAFSDTPMGAASLPGNVTEIQRTYSYPGSATTGTAVLPAPPTPGNLLLLVILGSAFTTPPPGFTLVVADANTTNDDVVIFERVAQKNDSQSVTYQTYPNWDDGALYAEYANVASTQPTYSEGDATFNVSTHTIASGSVGVPSGVFALAIFGLYLGANSPKYVPGATTLSNGFTLDSEHVATGTPNGSTYIFGHRIFTAAGTAQTTATVPNFNLSATQTQVIVAIALQQTHPVNPTDTRATISDLPFLSDTRSPTVTDTSPTNSDSPVLTRTALLLVADTRTVFADGLQVVDIALGTDSVALVDTRADISDLPAFFYTRTVSVSDSRVVFTDGPGIIHTVTPPPPVPVGAREPRVLIYNKSNVLQDIPGDVMSVTATTVVNGGASDCTITMPRSFALIGAIGEGYRVRIFLPDNYLLPWWDGRVTEVDASSSSVGGRIVVMCEGWETALNDAIATFTVTPGVQQGGTNNGQLDYSVFIAWLLSTYLPNGYSVVVPQSAGVNIIGVQVQYQGVADVLNTITQSILDVSNSHWEWYVVGGPNLTKQVLVQPVSINAAVPIALDKNADTNSYQVRAIYRDIKNLLALYGGTDPNTGVQLWSPYSNSTSISQYGVRQFQMSNNYLVTQDQLNQYAAAQLNLKAFPTFSGAWNMKRPSSAITAGKWVQVFEPELRGFRTMRLARVTVSWSKGTYIQQQCEPNAPLVNIDKAIYDTSASAQATGAALAALASGTTNLNGLSSVVAGGGVIGFV